MEEEKEEKGENTEGTQANDNIVASKEIQAQPLAHKSTGSLFYTDGQTSIECVDHGTEELLKQSHLSHGGVQTSSELHNDDVALSHGEAQTSLHGLHDDDVALSHGEAQTSLHGLHDDDVALSHGRTQTSLHGLHDDDVALSHGGTQKSLHGKISELHDDDASLSYGKTQTSLDHDGTAELHDDDMALSHGGTQKSLNGKISELHDGDVSLSYGKTQTSLDHDGTGKISELHDDDKSLSHGRTETSLHGKISELHDDDVSLSYGKTQTSLDHDGTGKISELHDEDMSLSHGRTETSLNGKISELHDGDVSLSYGKTQTSLDHDGTGKISELHDDDKSLSHGRTQTSLHGKISELHDDDVALSHGRMQTSLHGKISELHDDDVALSHGKAQTSLHDGTGKINLSLGTTQTLLDDKLHGDNDVNLSHGGTQTLLHDRKEPLKYTKILPMLRLPNYFREKPQLDISDAIHDTSPLFQKRKVDEQKNGVSFNSDEQKKKVPFYSAPDIKAALERFLSSHLHDEEISPPDLGRMQLSVNNEQWLSQIDSDELYNFLGLHDESIPHKNMLSDKNIEHVPQKSAQTLSQRDQTILTSPTYDDKRIKRVSSDTELTMARRKSQRDQMILTSPTYYYDDKGVMKVSSDTELAMGRKKSTKGVKTTTSEENMNTPMLGESWLKRSLLSDEASMLQKGVDWKRANLDTSEYMMARPNKPKRSSYLSRQSFNVNKMESTDEPEVVHYKSANLLSNIGQQQSYDRRISMLADYILDKSLSEASVDEDSPELMADLSLTSLHSLED